MSRIRRKERPKKNSWILRKSDLNSEILKPRQIGGVEQLSSTPIFETAFLSSIDAVVEPAVEL